MAKGAFVKKLIEMAEKAGLDISSGTVPLTGKQVDSMDTLKKYYEEGKKLKDSGVDIESQEFANAVLNDGKYNDSEAVQRYVYNEFGPIGRAFFEEGARGSPMPEKVMAWRYGDVPESGYSLNYRDGFSEPGVSVMQVYGEDIPGSVEFGRLYGSNKRPPVLVEGFRISKKGSDEEPIIVGAKKVAESTNEEIRRLFPTKKSGVSAKGNKDSANLMASIIPGAVGLSYVLGASPEAEAAEVSPGLITPDLLKQMSKGAQGSIQAPTNSRAMKAADLAAQYNEFRKERLHPVADFLLPVGELPEEMWRKRAYGDDVSWKDYLYAGLGML